MSFISRIINPSRDTENYKDSLYFELSNNVLPLVMYGAGDTAHAIVEVLKTLKVDLVAVVVDDEYYHSELTFEKYQVLPLSMLRDSLLNKEINIIVGFMPRCSKSDLEKHLRSIISFNKLFLLDSSHHQFSVGIMDDYDLNYEYIIQHEPELEFVYNICEDDESRDVLCNFINTKLTGNPNYISKVSNHNDVYFPPEILELEDNEIFVDCGAFTGDTVISFIQQCKNKYHKIYAFEPDVYNYKIAKQRLLELKLHDFVLVPFGLWDKEATLQFEAKGTAASSISNQPNNKQTSISSIQVVSLDSFIKNEPVSFIKMDIEGAEINAIKGASNIINMNKPKCAICAYHKKADLYEIAILLKKYNPNYKIYFRQYIGISVDLVCYAI